MITKFYCISKPRKSDKRKKKTKTPQDLIIKKPVKTKKQHRKKKFKVYTSLPQLIFQKQKKNQCQ
jgi:hypothetical protein